MTWRWYVLAALDVAVILYIWRSVQKVDDEVDASEAFRKELQEEMNAYNERHQIIPLPPADVDKAYEAFMCDGSDHPHPRNAA